MGEVQGGTVSCRKCWAPGATLIEVTKDDRVVAFGELCDACFEAAADRADELRGVFDKLVAGGVSREAANAHMIRLINEEASS